MEEQSLDREERQYDAELVAMKKAIREIKAKRKAVVPEKQKRLTLTLPEDVLVKPPHYADNRASLSSEKKEAIRADYGKLRKQIVEQDKPLLDGIPVDSHSLYFPTDGVEKEALPALKKDLGAEGTAQTKEEIEALVTNMRMYHLWQISLDKKLITKVVEEILVPTADGGQETKKVTKNYLIGYQNGLNARTNETHFAQKETDAVSHEIIFQPEPHFVSFSFFYGFFGQTIQTLCEQTLAATSDVNISNKNSILKQFTDKYAFRYLSDSMKKYAELMIENIVDIQAKVGKLNGRK